MKTSNRFENKHAIYQVLQTIFHTPKVIDSIISKALFELFFKRILIVQSILLSRIGSLEVE